MLEYLYLDIASFAMPEICLMYSSVDLYNFMYY